MPPKLFISYSWSTPDYEQEILRIATELRDAGIDVILDKWDLKEGHESTAFMEKMVADEHVKKVAIFCDKTYKEKADGRKGGVGTETQIISSEVYKAQDQNKFVAVVMERNDDGRACLPFYYSSRIYIDFSDPAMYATQFERLLRWAYDRPLDVKPEIGKTPAFLTDTCPHVRLATAVLARRAADSIRNGRDNALPATREYFDVFVAELEKLRLTSNGRESFDDDVIKSLDDFLPYRDEMIDILINLALYRDGPEMYRLIHRLFEQLIPYTERPANVSAWSERDFDNYRFIIHELYLYAVAIMLKHERFSAISVLTNELFVPSDRRNETMLGYHRIRENLETLRVRNDRLALQQLSLRANMLKARCTGLLLKFADLMQADFILYLRGQLDTANPKPWFPETLLYADEFRGAFEIFARSRSAAYFQNLKVVLGLSDKQHLIVLVKEFSSKKRRAPSWQYEYLDVETLAGIEKLETQA
jgi:hypothetical protein